MTKEFLKKQNIHLENIWVCYDLNGNVRSVDLEQLLEDYHEFKVKKLRLGAVSGSLPPHVKFELQKIAFADDEMASNPQAGIIYRNTIRDLLEPYCGNDR